MSQKEAYQIISKHVFAVWRTYAESDTVRIVMANDKEDALKKAQKYYGTSLVSISPLEAVTEDNDIFTF